ncbi:MAG: hypothetical protein H7308_08125 [Chthonomonadaceae bacterium]|nr:hypothetical protein [Chthonomonadaceae bacterium]
MTRVSPKPIIGKAIQTWKVAPSMTYALVRDLEGTLWIVESCPVGTQFWTLEQAENLASGKRSRMALREAIVQGNLILREQSAKRLVEGTPARDNAHIFAPASAPKSIRRASGARALHTGKSLVRA